MADETPETPAAKTEESPETAPAAATSGGGIVAWLPLIVTLVAMPALAYAMTAFVLLPKMKKELTAAAGVSAVEPSEAGKRGEEAKPKPAAGERSQPKEPKAKAAGPVRPAARRRRSWTRSWSTWPARWAHGICWPASR
jgi:hypothetical protein